MPELKAQFSIGCGLVEQDTLGLNVLSLMVVTKNTDRQNLLPRIWLWKVGSSRDYPALLLEGFSGL